MSNSQVSARFFYDVNFDNIESLQSFLAEHSSCRTVALDNIDGELVSYDIEEHDLMEAVELTEDDEDKPLKLKNSKNPKEAQK
ncbi:hypothetical protein ACIQ1D_18835 [Lysinibacillus xylanilyticus]|uniref:hypothetical protein n=1 Tax=Lysinibacillus xylanilyticus TaxID=582475 RepID=UPI0037FB5FD2